MSGNSHQNIPRSRFYHSSNPISLGVINSLLLKIQKKLVMEMDIFEYLHDLCQVVTFLSCFHDGRMMHPYEINSEAWYNLSYAIHMKH